LKINRVLNYCNVAWQYTLIIISDIVLSNTHDTLVTEVLELVDNVCDKGFAGEIH
jgi:hypothetical protein